MEKFLKFLITPLLSQPKDLVISATPESIIIKVADADVGRIIGKHGNVINAIRTLLRTFCLTHQNPYPNLTLDTPKKD